MTAKINMYDLGHFIDLILKFTPRSPHSACFNHDYINFQKFLYYTYKIDFRKIYHTDITSSLFRYSTITHDMSTSIGENGKLNAIQKALLDLFRTEDFLVVFSDNRRVFSHDNVKVVDRHMTKIKLIS